MLATSCASLLLKYSLMAATAVALYCTASAEGAPAVGLLGVLVDMPADTILSYQSGQVAVTKKGIKVSKDHLPQRHTRVIQNKYFVQRDQQVVQGLICKPAGPGACGAMLNLMSILLLSYVVKHGTCIDGVDLPVSILLEHAAILDVLLMLNIPHKYARCIKTQNCLRGSSCFMLFVIPWHLLSVHEQGLSHC